MEQKKILYADDDPEIREALQLLLSCEGYETVAANNGEEVLQLLDDSIDLVILDVMMPKLDGFTVLERIRSQGILIPVLMLTAKSEIDDKVHGLDAGANDYLTKPFAPPELLARIRAMLRTGAANVVADNNLTMGNITLNTSSYELSSPYGSFHLANKEFQMMEMLMRSRKSLIPAELFLEKIWGFETDAEINVVWVYISYLRKKLASLRADIQIKATRGVGYSLEQISC